ncbi:polyketide synthase, partial [Moorena sp. SIO3H5]|uniref:type I polyketide synthase n=1 Tax=Moorena sp. SIO3H5 TaxID=2607834 RepID=UPI0013B99244
MKKENSKEANLSTTKQLILALQQARMKLEEIENAKHEPIAVIGLGCQFPGGGDGPEAFWKVLENGIDAAVEIPKNRWNIDDYYDPNPATPGKMYTRFASLLEQPDRFDPEFFGISPREAIAMDPQHRLLLEVSWQGLEHAGIDPTKLKRTLTGVFVGMMTQDYSLLASNLGKADSYKITGNGISVAAGRLAYFLGLQGPTLTVDTACSSSLVAIHLACQSLRNKDCNLALACGVNLILAPDTFVEFAQGRMNSPDGRCKTFDAAADGYGRGEGCGVIVLKRLSDAKADEDKILALIRGSAINHDGPSSGLTVPYGPAQEELILQALSNAQVQPSQVDYVECHGTGTSLGDPIEVETLANVFCKNRSQENPLVISSVKTNIGHTEGAAGVAGVIKTVLALWHEKISPHLHLKQLNPKISWNNLPVVVPDKKREWKSGEKPRIAGVSSFGLSGINAHVILEEAPAQVTSQKSQLKTEDIPERPLHILSLSAKTPPALTELIKDYQQHLETNKEDSLADI